MDLNSIKNNTLKSIIKFSIPSIIAMLLTSMVTIVDGLFIGNFVGKDALAAINLGLPILYTYLAIGIMIGVGGISIAGRFLGSKDFRKSNNVFNQTVATTFVVVFSMSLVLAIIFGKVIGLIDLSQLVRVNMLDYYNIMIWTYPVMILNIVFGMFIRGEGRPQVFLIVTIVNNIINVTLDYIFVDLLSLGVKGAAWSSFISVVIAFVMMILYFAKISRAFKFSYFTFSKSDFKNTLVNGSSELIGQLSMSITSFVFNWVILNEVGVVGVTAFSIVSYLAYIFNMIIVGFGQGASPIISYSLGAGNIEICDKIRKFTNRLVIGIGIVVVIFMNLLSSWYSGIFVKDVKVIELVSHGIKIFTVAFLFSGVNAISSFSFTALGKAKESALISVSRGLIVLLICILLLPKLFGIDGIWLVSPVTELVTLVLAIYLLKKNSWNVVY